MRNFLIVIALLVLTGCEAGFKAQGCADRNEERAQTWGLAVERVQAMALECGNTLPEGEQPVNVQECLDAHVNAFIEYEYTGALYRY